MKLDDVHQQELHRLLTNHSEDSGKALRRKGEISNAVFMNSIQEDLTIFGGVKGSPFVPKAGKQWSQFTGRGLEPMSQAKQAFSLRPML